MSEASVYSDRFARSVRRLVLFTLLFVVMTAAGIYTVYDQFAGKSISFNVEIVHPGAILAMPVLLAVYFLSDGMRLYYTLRALGERVPFRVIMRLVFINLYFSNITPMATGGGVAQIWYLRRQGVTVGRATAATTIRTVLAVAVIFSLTPVFLLTLDALEGQSLQRDLGIALGVFVVVYLGFLTAVLLRPRRFTLPIFAVLRGLERLHLMSERSRIRRQHRVRREIMRFARSFGVYRHGQPSSVLLSGFFTVVFLLSLFSVPALLMAALGYEFNYLTSLGLMNVTTFIMYFSPTPGASGISEGVFGSFFRGILSANHLVLVTVAWRLLTIYLGMVVGLLLLQRELLIERSRIE